MIEKLLEIALYHEKDGYGNRLGPLHIGSNNSETLCGNFSMNILKIHSVKSRHEFAEFIYDEFERHNRENTTICERCWKKYSQKQNKGKYK